MEGLVRGLQVFRGVITAPIHQLKEPAQRQQMVVKASTQQIRPYVVCAIMRDITFDEDSYASFLDLQDKLHMNICRRRTLVAIGTHNLDSVQGPFSYQALPPSDINFVPLFETKTFQSKDYMDHIRTDPNKKNNLGKYTDIIYDSPVYPVIKDANNTVMSMPPIINGEHSKMSQATKNILIECTATDYTKALVTLNTMLAMFGEYCKVPFTYEPVDVVYETDGATKTTPDLSEPEFRATMKEVKNIIGASANVTPEMACELAAKMMLRNPRYDAATDEIVVGAPCTRADILHECDVVEDIAVAYGFNNIKERIPPTLHLGKEQNVMRLTELLRFELAGAGFIEALTFGLMAEREAYSYLNRPNDGNSCVKMSNPMDENNEIVRPALLPGLLKTIACNREVGVAKGLRLFEVSDICRLDPTTDTGARNERHACVVYTGPTAGLEIIHGVVDRLFELLNVRPELVTEKQSMSRGEIKEMEESKSEKPTTSGDTIQRYILQEQDNATYFPSRSANILIDMGDGRPPVKIGEMGVLHPDVLTKFQLGYPVSCMEIDLEMFVDITD
jgi:phenylalanyl-tRNA synthetase beta chain